MRIPMLLLCGIAAVTAALPAKAQLPLGAPLPEDPLVINIDTPATLAPGAVGARAELRAFGGDEDMNYIGITGRYGFAPGWEGVLRGTIATDRDFNLPAGRGQISHGGSSAEVMAKYRLPVPVVPVALMVGVAFPDTPAQSDPLLTVGASAAFSDPLGRVTGYVNPRAVFIQDNVLVGLGLGARARLSDNVSLIADVTPIVAGDNTRDTDTGNLKKRATWGVGVRYDVPTPIVSTTLDIGYTNGMPGTTGFGLTPGLGGDGAFFVAVTARR